MELGELKLVDISNDLISLPSLISDGPGLFLWWSRRLFDMYSRVILTLGNRSHT
jgi:hypothetical protein